MTVTLPNPALVEETLTPMLRLNVRNPHLKYKGRGDTGLPTSLPNNTNPTSSRDYTYWMTGAAKPFGSLDQWGDWQEVYTLPRHDGFQMDWSMNNVVGWLCRLSFPVEQRAQADRFRELVQIPGCALMWVLARESDNPDDVEKYLAGKYFDENYFSYQSVASYPLPLVGENPLTFMQADTIPEMWHRVGSGLVQHDDMYETDDGIITVIFSGGCWATQLNETRQLYAEDTRTVTGVGNISNFDGRSSFMSDRRANADHQPSLDVLPLPFPGIPGTGKQLTGEELDKRIKEVARFGLATRSGVEYFNPSLTDKLPGSGVALPLDADAERIVLTEDQVKRRGATPVGAWGLYPVFSDRLRQSVPMRSTDTPGIANWGGVVGSHFLLYSEQLMLESSGLRMDTTKPLMVIDTTGGIGRTHTWDLGAMRKKSSRISSSRPKATVWIIEHSDDAGESRQQATYRNLRLLGYDVDLVDIYGEIHETLESRAPKIRSDDDLVYELDWNIETNAVFTEAERDAIEGYHPYIANDRHTYHRMLLQANKEAIVQKTNLSANLDVEPVAPYRAFLDFLPGDHITLYSSGKPLNPTDGNGTIVPTPVRNLGLSWDRNNVLSQNVGLGLISEIDPTWFDKFTIGGYLDTSHYRKIQELADSNNQLGVGKGEEGFGSGRLVYLFWNTDKREAAPDEGRFAGSQTRQLPIGDWQWTQSDVPGVLSPSSTNLAEGQKVGVTIDNTTGKATFRAVAGLTTEPVEVTFTPTASDSKNPPEIFTVIVSRFTGTTGTPGARISAHQLTPAPLGLHIRNRILYTGQKQQPVKRVFTNRFPC